MVWAALGLGLQGYGSFVGGEAAKSDARTQANQARLYQGAYGTYSGWQDKGQQELIDRLQGLSLQGTHSYDTLGRDLNDPTAQVQARDMAGTSAVAANQGRLQAALASNPAAVTRPNTGSGGGFSEWGDNTNAQRYAPVMQARTALLNQNAGQAGRAIYDRNALGRAGTRQVVIGQQSAQAQQQENALAAYRQMLLERAGVADQYRGPSAGTYNAQLQAAGLNLAGQAAMSYGQYRSNQPQQQPQSGQSSSGTWV